jgi:hypothetical protein
VLLINAWCSDANRSGRLSWPTGMMVDTFRKPQFLCRSQKGPNSPRPGPPEKTSDRHGFVDPLVWQSLFVAEIHPDIHLLFQTYLKS